MQREIKKINEKIEIRLYTIFFTCISLIIILDYITN
jgi:hypothetical protein